jgi:hypothetical protein
MKNRMRSGVVSFVLALGTVVVLPANAADLTHVGQPASRLVVLHSAGPQPRWFREFPDGSSVLWCHTNSFPQEDRCASIPDGMVLVITDVEWHQFFFKPNDSSPIWIRLKKGANTSIVYRWWAVADATGHFARNDYLTTGFVVGRGVEIEIPDFNLSTVILRGYFVPDL